MKINPAFMDEKRQGLWVPAPVQRAMLDGYRQLVLTMIAVLLVLMFISIGHAHAQPVVPAPHLEEVSAILYAESASDPDGWIPKLNTYYKTLRSGEALVDGMRRVSSAYRTKSKQYRKASSKDLNAFERRVYDRIVSTVKSFRPDPH